MVTKAALDTSKVINPSGNMQRMHIAELQQRYWPILIAVIAFPIETAIYRRTGLAPY
jgi:hypothetical protein